MKTVGIPYDSPAYVPDILFRLLALPVQFLHLVLALPDVFRRGGNLSVFKINPSIFRPQFFLLTFSPFCHVINDTFHFLPDVLK